MKDNQQTTLQSTDAPVVKVTPEEKAALIERMQKKVKDKQIVRK